MNTKGYNVFTAATIYGHIGFIISSADEERLMGCSIDLEDGDVCLQDMQDELFGPTYMDAMAHTRTAILRAMIIAGFTTTQWLYSETTKISKRNLRMLRDVVQEGQIVFVSEENLKADMVRIMDETKGASVYSPLVKSMMLHAFAPRTGPHSSYKAINGKSGYAPFWSMPALSAAPISLMCFNKSDIFTTYSSINIPICFPAGALECIKEEGNGMGIDAQYRFIVNALARSGTYHNEQEVERISRRHTLGSSAPYVMKKRFPHALGKIFAGDNEGRIGNSGITDIQRTPDGLMAVVEVSGDVSANLIKSISDIILLPAYCNKKVLNESGRGIESFRVTNYAEQDMAECLVSMDQSQTTRRQLLNQMANSWTRLQDIRHRAEISEIAADALLAVHAFTDVDRTRDEDWFDSMTTGTFESMVSIVRRVIRVGADASVEELHTLWNDCLFVADQRNDVALPKLFGGLLGRVTTGFLTPICISFLRYLHVVVTKGTYDRIVPKYLQENSPVRKINAKMHEISGLDRFEVKEEPKFSYNRAEPTNRGGYLVPAFMQSTLPPYSDSAASTAQLDMQLRYFSEKLHTANPPTFGEFLNNQAHRWFETV